MGASARADSTKKRALASGGCSTAPAAECLVRTVEEVADARIDLLLRQLLARLVDQRRAVLAAAAGIIEHGQRGGDIAAGGGALRLGQYQPLALGADLR